jgi:hypothetical protein
MSKLIVGIVGRIGIDGSSKFARTAELGHFCLFCSVSSGLGAWGMEDRGSWQPRSYGQRTSGGRLIRIASTLPPVFRPNRVPRSWIRLNST